SKFSLVTLSALRARQINAYFNQLGEGLGTVVPPQVTSVARKPLSIAFEEIASGKIVPAQGAEAGAADGEASDAAPEAEEGRECSRDVASSWGSRAESLRTRRWRSAGS